MKCIVGILFFISFACQSQVKISGKILDEFGFPVADVLVYVDGSSISVFTDTSGHFTLKIPEGNYQLVFRKDDFELQTLSVNPQTQFLEIVLQKSDRVNLDEAVIVQLSSEKWKEYFTLFQELFLGQNEAAKNCIIQNPKVLKFTYDQDNLTFSARANSPLRIENKYLGYIVEYDLTDFYMDFKTHQQYIAGTSLFAPMNGSKPREKKWTKNRENSYQGSLMHFIRSLYEEKLKENGFIVNRLIRKENPDYVVFKKRVQAMLDSGEAPKIQAAPPPIIQTLVLADVPYDSLRVRSGAKVFLNFEGLYDIEFMREKEDLEYVHRVKGQNLIGNQVSVLYLLNKKWVEIESNGNFYPPTDMMMEGYFTWEKIANLLPLDYQSKLE